MQVGLILFTKDDARLTLEFFDHYMIKLSIAYSFHPDYKLNPLGEKGQYVAEGFEYSSETNPWFLNVEEISD